MATKNWKRPITIKASVTAAEESANQSLITVTTNIPSDSFEFIHQVKRSGVEIPGFSASYSTTTGILTVADAGAADLTSGDVIMIQGTFFN